MREGAREKESKKPERAVSKSISSTKHEIDYEDRYKLGDSARRRRKRNRPEKGKKLWQSMSQQPAWGKAQTVT